MAESAPPPDDAPAEAPRFHLPTVKDPQGFAVHAFHSARVAAAESLARANEEGSDEAALRIQGFAQTSIEAFEAGDRLACTMGCTHCCHISVPSSVPEAFLVARYLRATLTPLERFMARAALAVDEQYATEDRLQHNKACAFLGDDKLCTIYPMRPLACRGWHSLDLSACEAGFARGNPQAPVPQILARMTTASAITFGICTAAADRGLDGRPVTFVAAVRAALDDATWLDRWLAGDRTPEALVDPVATADWSANDYGPLAVSQAIIGDFGPLPGLRPSEAARPHESDAASD